MLVAAFTWGGLWRLAATVAQPSAFTPQAGDSVLPVIGKVGGSVHRVNGQLDKVDRARWESHLADELREAGT